MISFIRYLLGKNTMMKHIHENNVKIVDPIFLSVGGYGWGVGLGWGMVWGGVGFGG